MIEYVADADNVADYRSQAYRAAANCFRAYTVRQDNGEMLTDIDILRYQGNAPKSRQLKCKLVCRKFMNNILLPAFCCRGVLLPEEGDGAT